MRPSFPRAGLPLAMAGAKIGLLGGSFDPAHKGHVAITRAALRSFGLDEVWWLVSPGNPLKTKGPAPIEARMQAARKVMSHPKVKITPLESRLGTRYTADTLAALHQLYPQVTFVWLMGSDNMASFHHWQRWQQIAQTTAIGVLARPGSQMAARVSVMARRFAKARVLDSHSLTNGPSPRWAMVNLPLDNASSSAIRAKGGWHAT